MSDKSLELDIEGPYANGGKIIVFPEGDSTLTREPLIWTPGPEDEYYTVRPGDNLERIAYRAFKDYVPNPGRYYWVIADVNGITNPLDLSDFEGTDILIPNILNVKRVFDERA